MQLQVALRAVLLILIALVIEATVQRVRDGDTVVVINESGREIVCRLHAIDAPEKAQPFGEEASAALREMVEGKEVRVGLTGERSYGREICVIEKDGANINAAMVRLGMAWAARPYLKTEEDRLLYLGAEADARADGIGLWNSIGPTPPWKWRRDRAGRNR